MTTNNIDLFAGFEDEVIAATTLPYAQIQNPPNMQASQLTKMQPPMGIFIPLEQASLAGFQPDSHWELTTLTFGSSEVEGYLGKKVRYIVLNQSPLYVQEKTERGYRNIDVAYRNGNPTKALERSKMDSMAYRLRSNLIMMFLSDDNQLLHSTPIKLGLSSAVGVGLNMGRKANVDEVTKTIFKSMGKPLQRLSLLAQSLIVTDMTLGFVKPSASKAAYLYPSSRLSCEGNGKSTNRDKVTELVATDISNLVIPKMSELGKTIVEAFDLYQDYFTKAKDDTNDYIPEVADEVVQLTPQPVDFDTDIPF